MPKFLLPRLPEPILPEPRFPSPRFQSPWLPEPKFQLPTLPNPTLTVAGTSALGAGGGATVTLDVLVEIDHFPCGKPGICGSCNPDGDDADADADGKASTLGINTGRVDTTPDDDAASFAVPGDPTLTAERLLAPAEEPSEPADALPRPACEPAESCVPGSASATRGLTSDVPIAAVNAPAMSQERSPTTRERCGSATTEDIGVRPQAAWRSTMRQKIATTQWHLRKN